MEHRLPPCGSPWANGQGFESKYELPRERDPRYYTILVLGGSVADMFASGAHDRIWLEEFLNARFVSPNRRPFRVINGAIASGRYPVQNNVLTFYGASVDAAISIDGYNEAINVDKGAAIDAPAAMLYLSLIRAPRSSSLFFWLRVVRQARYAILNHKLLRGSFLAHFLCKKALGSMAHVNKKEGISQELLGRYFELPDDWTPDERKKWNMSRYETYVRLLKAQAGAFPVKFAYFLQPVSGIGKTLTAEESARSGRLSRSGEDRRLSSRTYLSFVRSAQTLRSGGVPAFDLTDLFREIPGTVYSDDVHFFIDYETGESLGNELMAERIGETLARAWGLKPKTAAR